MPPCTTSIWQPMEDWLCTLWHVFSVGFLSAHVAGMLHSEPCSAGVPDSCPNRHIRLLAHAFLVAPIL